MSQPPLKQAKILLYDIETSPNTGYYWQHPWDTSIIQTIEEWHLLSFAWKWLGDDKVHVLALPDFEKEYANDPNDDFALVERLHKLMSEADIVVAHNGDAFDQKKAAARFAVYALDPPEPFKQIDILKVARKYFNFTSNKLDDLGQTLHLGRKVKHLGFEMWLGCMSGDPKSWALMKKYNKGDVVLLEKVYLRFRPWINNHPSMNLLEGKEDGCPKCGSSHLISRGVYHTQVAVYRRYQCTDCGGWSRSRRTEPTEQVEVVN